MDLINVHKYDYPVSTRSIHEGSRHYTIADILEGQPLPSVTSILSSTQTKEKFDSLQRWRDRVGQDKAAEITKTSAARGTARRIGATSALAETSASSKSSNRRAIIARR